MLERKIQKHCVAYARSRGWWARKLAGQGRRSLPDYIFARFGVVLFVEFKKTGEKPTELQEEEHKVMRAAHLCVYVIDDVERFKALIDRWVGVTDSVINDIAYPRTTFRVPATCDLLYQGAPKLRDLG